VPPVDHYADLRDDMVKPDQRWIQRGARPPRGRHRGQAEINYKFNTLLHAADDLQLFKYIVKNAAWPHGKTATFMPKPLFGDNGSGMHCHQSLWKDGSPLFYDEPATRACPTPPGTTSAACCSTLRACWRSPTRP
jgi:glutamine synthetase